MSSRCSSCAGACCASKGTSRTPPAATCSCCTAAATRANIAWPKSMPTPERAAAIQQQLAELLQDAADLTASERRQPLRDSGKDANLNSLHATLRSPAPGRARLRVGATGCRWNQWFRRSADRAAADRLYRAAQPDEAVAAVNANTQRVQSLQTQGATISIPGVPAIGAEIAIERPRQLRMRAGTQLARAGARSGQQRRAVLAVGRPDARFGRLFRPPRSVRRPAGPGRCWRSSRPG